MDIGVQLTTNQGETMGLKTVHDQDGRVAAANMQDDGTLYEILNWPGSLSRTGKVAQRFGQAEEPATPH